jgi:hypothetical protein
MDETKIKLVGFMAYHSTGIGEREVIDAAQQELAYQGNVGVEMVQLAKNIEVYPNPTNGEFIIPNVETIEAVQITALNGQTTTVNFQLNGNDLILDLQGFANGLYTIAVTTKENVIVSKVNLTR